MTILRQQTAHKNNQKQQQKCKPFKIEYLFTKYSTETTLFKKESVCVLF